MDGNKGAKAAFYQRSINPSCMGVKKESACQKGTRE